MTDKRTITVTIGDDITITIDEPIPYVPAEQVEQRCALCKIRPSEGIGRCGSDCRRPDHPIDDTDDASIGARIKTLDELHNRRYGPQGGASWA